MRTLCLTLIHVVVLALVGFGERCSAQEQNDHIDPAGISGALVLSGSDLPDEALARFFELAGGSEARVVVFDPGKDEEDRDDTRQRLLAKWSEQGGASLSFVRIDLSEDSSESWSNALDSATGVWISGKELEDQATVLMQDSIVQELRQLLDRGGVIGSAGELSSVVATQRLPDAEDDPLKPGTGLLPDSIVSVVDELPESSPVIPRLEKDRALIGYEIGARGALVVRGRRVSAAGEADQVRAFLASGPSREAKELALNGRRAIADLTALRRSARVRNGAAFPAAEPKPPRVEKGTLMLVGGGRLPEGLVDRFVELAGSEEAVIVILPTAVPDPVPSQRRIAKLFRDAGAREVSVRKERRRTDVESDEFLDAFRNATGIWFGGGRQWRFVDAYLGTQVEPLLHDVLKRGGVIAGSSAGASIQAEYMARGNPLGNRDIMADGYEQGLGFLAGAAVDQHFRQRGRFRDMTSLIQTYPQLLGIGIDESTALVVQGQIGEVMGAGDVHFYDAQREVAEGENDYESVSADGRYDLVERKVLE